MEPPNFAAPKGSMGCDSAMVNGAVWQQQKSTCEVENEPISG